MDKMIEILKQRIIKYIVGEKEIKENKKLDKDSTKIKNVKIKKMLNLIIIKWNVIILESTMLILVLF